MVVENLPRRIQKFWEINSPQLLIEEKPETKGTKALLYFIVLITVIWKIVTKNYLQLDAFLTNTEYVFSSNNRKHVERLCW